MTRRRGGGPRSLLRSLSERHRAAADGAHPRDSAGGAPRSGPRHGGLGRPLPASYEAFLRSFDGADSFHETVVVAGVGPAAPVRLAELPQDRADELTFALAVAGDRYALDGDGRVVRTDAGADERERAGSTSSAGSMPSSRASRCFTGRTASTRPTCSTPRARRSRRWWRCGRPSGRSSSPARRARRTAAGWRSAGSAEPPRRSPRSRRRRRSILTIPGPYSIWAAWPSTTDSMARLWPPSGGRRSWCRAPTAGVCSAWAARRRRQCRGRSAARCRARPRRGAGRIASPRRGGGDRGRGRRGRRGGGRAVGSDRARGGLRSAPAASDRQRIG